MGTPGTVRALRSSPRKATAACAALLALAVPARAAGGAPRDAAAAGNAVCIRSACFNVEVAVTADERAKGLMHREALAGDRGMLFVFPEEAPHRFWMKNTLIELDIVFIGADRRIVGIVRRAQPCRTDPCESFGPDAAASYALEVAGGLCDRLGIAAGDLVEFRTPAPRGE